MELQALVETTLECESVVQEPFGRRLAGELVEGREKRALDTSKERSSPASDVDLDATAVTRYGPADHEAHGLEGTDALRNHGPADLEGDGQCSGTPGFLGNEEEVPVLGEGEPLLLADRPEYEGDPGQDVEALDQVVGPRRPYLRHWPILRG